MEPNDVAYTFISGFRFPVILPATEDFVLKKMIENYRLFINTHKEDSLTALKEKLKQVNCLLENNNESVIRNGSKIKVLNNEFYPKGGDFSLLFIKLEIFIQNDRIAILFPAPNSKNEIRANEFIRIRKQKANALSNEDILKIISLLNILNDCLVETPKMPILEVSFLDSKIRKNCHSLLKSI